MKQENKPWAERMDTPFGAYCHFSRLHDTKEEKIIDCWSGPNYTKAILIDSLKGILIISAIFGIPIGLLGYNELQNKLLSNKTTLSESNNDLNTEIYEIGQHSIVTKSTKKELTNTINNVPHEYDIDKIEKLDNNEYKVYFINNTKVVVKEDNQFGIEIENSKLKTK